MPSPQNPILTAPRPWAFGDPHNAEWLTHRDQTHAAMDRWWSAFEAKRADLHSLFSGGERWDLPRFMAENLQSLSPDLMWEFGPGLQGGHRLVITPEAEKGLRPRVRTLLERAPALEGWEFHAHRVPEDHGLLEANLNARGLKSLVDSKVALRIGDHHQVDVLLTDASFSGSSDEAAVHAALIACELLLGEQALDVWVGAIDVAQHAPEGLMTFPIAELRGRFQSAIEFIQGELPQKPLHRLPVENWDGRLWELKPKEAKDYPRQEDLNLIHSSLPPQWLATRSSAAFYSERFSTCNEVFAYLKLDGQGREPASRLDDRIALEKRLDPTLRDAANGTVIGAGTGLRYAYIELALGDVQQALPLIRKALRDGGAPRRSWLLFHDAEFAHEWIGAFDETPAPPR